MRASFSLFLIGALLPHVAQGQRAPLQVAVSARIRVAAPALGPEPRVARVVASGPDTIVVQTSDNFAVAVPVDQITRLEAFAGKQPQKKRFALLGAAVGTLGMVDPKYNAVAGAALGAMIGTLVGQVWQVDRWEPVTAITRSARVQPSHPLEHERGPRVRLTFAVR